MTIKYSEIQRDLDGMWPDILLTYGIDVGEFRGLNTKNSSCPCCGGSDRAHWRESNGRVSLFCRGCCPDSMKSAEDVILELTNMNFNELVGNLANYINHVPLEKIQQAKVKAKAMPSRNMPPDHKQDHELVERFLAKCEWCHSMNLLGKNAPNPQQLPTKANVDYWPMYNKVGVAVNLVKYQNDQPSFIAGGISYGALYTIKGSNHLIITTNPIDGILCWYKTKATVLIAFTNENLRYCLAMHSDLNPAVCGRDFDFISEFEDDYAIRLLSGDAYGVAGSETDFIITNPKKTPYPIIPASTDKGCNQQSSE
jgi:hypothetical protein